MAEVEAERRPVVVPEQYCSGWPSSASGARSTAPGSGVEASVSRYPGCSAPAAGQNRAWCSPSDLNKRFHEQRYCKSNFRWIRYFSTRKT